MHGELPDSRPDYFRLSVGDARPRIWRPDASGSVHRNRPRRRTKRERRPRMEHNDGQRGNRMAENIAICRRLWTEDDVSYSGKYRSFTGVTIKPRPIQQPCPIWIAANPPPTQSEPPLRPRRENRRRMDDRANFPGMLADLWSKLQAICARKKKIPTRSRPSPITTST